MRVPLVFCILICSSLIMSCFIVTTQSQPGTGFLSIDCGSAMTSNYTDRNDSTGIVWTPDSMANMMTLGESYYVSDNQKIHYYVRFQTFRFFRKMANHSKYCYSLSSAIQEGGIYIVRATFYMGTTTGIYPIGTEVVSFKLIIDSYVASDIHINLTQEEVTTKEFYVKANTSELYVCVAPSENDPFISSIELRPIYSSNNYGAMVVETYRHPLVLVLRTNFDNNNSTIRYPNDTYDRIWDSVNPPNFMSTSNSIITSNSFDIPPQRVLQTVRAEIVSVDETYTSYSITNDKEKHQYLHILYFAEINATVDKEGMRVFDVEIVSDLGSLPVATIDIFKLAGGSFKEYALANVTSGSGNYINTTYTSRAPSILPPITAGMELMQFLDFPFPLGTSSSDESIIESLSTQLSSYKGDPCLPLNFSFPWLSCNNVEDQTRITEIALSNFGLEGGLPTSLNNLTQLTIISLSGNNFVGPIPDLSLLLQLEKLDLSNNKLSGPIPNFLAKLPNLKVLDLENNNLSGPIPSELLDNNEINFKYSGNVYLSKPTGSSSSHRIPIIVGIVIGVIVLVGFIMAILYYYKRQKSTNVETTLVNVQDIDATIYKTNAFSYKDIIEATNNFTHILGHGGFGTVYKGKLLDNSLVAIKILSIGVDIGGQGVQEFKNEVTLLSNVHHKNIVQLIGYCIEQKLALVYELMPNGSLFDALFGSQLYLDWIQRLTILVDSAQGLEYLHHQCAKQIIHRDVKSTNILLDNNFRGKIADLGISKDNDSATRLMGSFGYLDPEYAQTLHLTTLVDIYSFGVVLLEVITGKPSMVKTSEGHQLPLVELVKSLVESANLEELVDKRLKYNQNAMWIVVDIAIQCTKYNSSQRPQKMGEIVTCLSEALKIEQKENYSGSQGHLTSGLNVHLLPR